MDFTESQDGEGWYFVQNKEEIDTKCLLKEGGPTEEDIECIVREISGNPGEERKLFELTRVNNDDAGYISGDSTDNAKDFTDGMTILKHQLNNQTYEGLAAVLSDPSLNRKDLVVKVCCIHEDLLPTYILARGNQAVTAYRGALKSGETPDNRVKVILIGDDQVGKTSVEKALRAKTLKSKDTHGSEELGQVTEKNRPVLPQTDGGISLLQPVDRVDEEASLVEEISLYDEVDCVRRNSPEKELEIWELSGQGVYRAIHPMFMTPDAVYILVFDLSKRLFQTSREEDNENSLPPNSGKQDSNLDCIMRWMDILNSLKYSADGETLPPVILVGTHADRVEGDPEKIMGALLDRFRNIKLGDQIKGKFVLDKTRNVNDQEDRQIANLRRRILYEANKLPHAKKKIPRKWFDIERKIQEEAKRGVKYFTSKEVFTKEIVKKVCQTQDVHDIDQILHFLCDRRSIIYPENASEEDGLVVLDPQWLADGLCKVLNKEEDVVEFRNLRHELRETGILHQKLFDHACLEWGVQEIQQPLVSLMKHYNLLFSCPSKDRGKEDCNEQPSYLVPSMIRRKMGEDKVISSKNGSSTHPPIYLTFRTKFVPMGLFSRLAVLIGAWAATKSSSEQPQIYADTAHFILEGKKFLELKCLKSVIRLQVWSQDSTDPLYADPGFYFEIYRCLERSLEAIRTTCHWLRSVSRDLCVQCCVQSCPGTVNSKTGKCIWHDREKCPQEDCAHYIPLKRHATLYCPQTMTCLPEGKFKMLVQALENNNSQERKVDHSSAISRKENLALPSRSSTNEITVLLLAEEWGSGKGGLSTISRELAIELAKYSNLRIHFYVINSSEEDKQMAKRSNINVIKAKERPGFNNGFDRLAFPPVELPEIDVVIGHGVKLGKQAQIIQVKHPRCVWVQFEHTAPEELGAYKNYEGNIARGETKHCDEVGLAELADIVAAIGPKLTEYYKTSLRPFKGGPDKVFQMTPDPSMFHEFHSCEQDREDRDNFNVLIFGRGDSEDFELKGFDIAAAAVAELKDGRYHLYAVGATHGQQEVVRKKLLQYGLSESQLTVRGFIERRDKVAQLLCEVDLAIMPSRTEGFGLTALEALAAGLPILVGADSGFAKALQNIKESACIVNDNDIKEWAKAIRGVKGKPRSTRLEEAMRLKERYQGEFSWSKRCKTLLQKINLLVEKKRHSKDMKDEQKREDATNPEENEEDETQNQSQTTRTPDAVEELEPTDYDEGYSCSKDRTNSNQSLSGHEETRHSLVVEPGLSSEIENTRLNKQQNGSQLEQDENQKTDAFEKNSTQEPRQRKNLPSQTGCDGKMTKDVKRSRIEGLQCWRTRSCLMLLILVMLIAAAFCLQL